MNQKNNFNSLPEKEKKKIISKIRSEFGAPEGQEKAIRSDVESGAFLPKVFKQGMPAYGGGTMASSPVTQAPMQPPVTQPTQPIPQSRVSARPNFGINPVDYQRPAMVPSYQQALNSDFAKNPVAVMTPEEIQKINTFVNYMRGQY